MCVWKTATTRGGPNDGADSDTVDPWIREVTDHFCEMIAVVSRFGVSLKCEMSCNTTWSEMTRRPQIRFTVGTRIRNETDHYSQVLFTTVPAWHESALFSDAGRIFGKGGKGFSIRKGLLLASMTHSDISSAKEHSRHFCTLSSNSNALAESAAYGPRLLIQHRSHSNHINLALESRLDWSGLNSGPR